MLAVYGLLGLEKQVDPIFPAWYDVRILANAAKTCLGVKELPLSQIPLGKLLGGNEMSKFL